MGNNGMRGFTLVELLVVIAIIALLAMMLYPMLSGFQEQTRAAICKNNLKELASAVTMVGDRPFPGQWREFAKDKGYSAVLNCPSDDREFIEEEPQEAPDLADLYLVQKQGNDVRFSNVQVVMDTGTSPEDSQITRASSAHGYTTTPSQMLIKVGGDCALMRVTQGENVSFESLIIGTATHNCGSTHWLCIDDGSPSWRDRIVTGIGTHGNQDEYQPDSDIFIMRLQSGPKYTKKWPDVSVIRSKKSSYAMSDAVSNEDPRPGQLMFVEYAKDVAKVDKLGFQRDEFGNSNTDKNGVLRTRHYNMAHFVTTGGSVRSMTREQLRWEYDRYADGVWGP